MKNWIDMAQLLGRTDGHMKKLIDMAQLICAFLQLFVDKKQLFD
jgi:hypothetical protein